MDTVVRIIFIVLLISIICTFIDLIFLFTWLRSVSTHPLVFVRLIYTIYIAIAQEVAVDTFTVSALPISVCASFALVLIVFTLGTEVRQKVVVSCVFLSCVIWFCVTKR